ncbi:hypothetical protein RCG23_16040 [Neobacillus sp. PS3-34]|uniref:hypothetical protein n=1 Tax=Neobacillus sp. PS3-34 TaxID=3070678 RepID=UPI0027E05B9A|nr:hypothetical protein [Neobacillus sp. PS3-34]WML47088.1 hypothetical protein RCG23_16040 [Neobacillus sp. PS3-34]
MNYPYPCSAQFIYPYPIYYSPVPYIQNDLRTPQTTPLPVINPAFFMESAKTMQRVLEDAQTIVGKIAGSKQFSQQLMSAAQSGKMDAVRKIIYSAGVGQMPRISYNPDGLHLEFTASVHSQACCRLIVVLRWL